MLPTLSPLWQLVGLLVVHWIGDFVLQSSWMARNKSERFDALIAHVLTYGVALAVGAIVIFGFSSPKSLSIFILLNVLLHFATDYVTSRITAEFRRREQWHAFFIAIGADQLSHQICLALTVSVVIGQS